jgi:hypothetical protein
LQIFWTRGTGKIIVLVHRLSASAGGRYTRGPESVRLVKYDPDLVLNDRFIS